MWCKCKRLEAAVPVVHGVGVVRERLWGRDRSVRPVGFGRRGGRGRGMVEGRHGGATGGRHGAGGLHSRKLLLLVGTEVNGRAKDISQYVRSSWFASSYTLCWCGKVVIIKKKKKIAENWEISLVIFINHILILIFIVLIKITTGKKQGFLILLLLFFYYFFQKDKEQSHPNTNKITDLPPITQKADLNLLCTLPCRYFAAS